ncbi:MAG: hypothetical protein U0744_19615 [Gemmataceae bacterium]
MSWYRNDENHPVAVVRFNTDRPRPLMQLTNVAVHDGQDHDCCRPAQQ